jgi:hypothetical protein
VVRVSVTKQGNPLVTVLVCPYDIFHNCYYSDKEFNMSNNGLTKLIKYIFPRIAAMTLAAWGTAYALVMMDNSAKTNYAPYLNIPVIVSLLVYVVLTVNRGYKQLSIQDMDDIYQLLTSRFRRSLGALFLTFGVALLYLNAANPPLPPEIAILALVTVVGGFYLIFI